MGENSAIEWTDHTFNPWWGCVRVSPGCGMGKSVGGCYAEAFAKRTGHNVWGKLAPRRFFGDKHWAVPLKWDRDAHKRRVRARVFCASMADVFEDRRDLDEHRERLWRLIEETSWLDWQILTKRPQTIWKLAPSRWLQNGFPRNVWLGMTAESQFYYDVRWPIVASLPVSVRFVSHEPAIGPLTIRAFDVKLAGGGGRLVFPSWVITGGESGGGPRPYDIAWARSLVQQTRETGTRLLVKQLGANPVGQTHDGLVRLRLKDRAHGGNMTEWPEDLRIREFPASAA